MPVSFSISAKIVRKPLAPKQGIVASIVLMGRSLVLQSKKMAGKKAVVAANTNKKHGQLENSN